MFNLFNEPFVFRTEPSRVSYNIQTEEFRSLNANLQTYLGDIKTIDDENRQLQENIQTIRTKYLATIEDHLTRLPNDFRVQSGILTDAHLQRYQFKSRTRRLLNEREEFKRRIQFVANHEKDQIKYLTLLEKQERTNRNEFEKLNEQYRRLLKSVEHEKEIHRRAMEKVDQLYVQFEQVCLDRSKTEFEIQSLKEELQLMQTTKEFLSEECQTIISTQMEANEYLLSRLNDSISRIREDFEQLNQTQLQQMENEYKQMLQTLEESLPNESSPPILPSEHEQLEQEYRNVLEELQTLNNQNQHLTQRALAMEGTLYSIRNDRMEQLMSKDEELDRSKQDLQILNDKLTHLAEYDRNLQFELTLYRGVLESESRRKQQINQTHLIRPTSLRTSHPSSITDRRTWWTGGTNQKKSTDQQQEEILTNAPTDPSNDRKPSRSSSTTVSEDHSLNSSIPSTSTQSRRLPTPPEVRSSPTNTTSFAFETLQTSPQQYQVLSDKQQPSSRTSSISAETSLELHKSPTSSTAPTIVPEQLESSQAHQPSTRTSSVSSRKSLDFEKTPLLERQSSTSDIRQVSPTPPQEHQPSSRTSSVVQEQQSRTSSFSSKASADVPTVLELRSSTPSARQLSSTPAEHPQPSADIQQPSASTEENQPSSRTSSISSKAPADTPDLAPLTSDIRRLSSTPVENPQISSDIQPSPTIDTDIQEKTSPFIPDDYQVTTSTDAFGNEDQSVNSFVGTDDMVQFEESVSYTTDDKALSEVDRNEQRQSPYFTEPLLTEDSEFFQQTEPNESRGAAAASPLPADISPEQGTENLPESYELAREEDDVDSSLRNQTEEKPSTNNISSTITSDQNLNEFTSLLFQDPIKPSSDHASFSDVEEVDLSTSPRLETRSDDDEDPNLAIIMQDLRYVFHELVNDEDVVEIDHALPDRILDRLEFRDHFIRTLFDGLIRKYLVQPALQSARPNVLDWIEFRDILFPIITGRYTERHIRKLFDLLDITQDGYLSLQEIAELLEVLHANDTIDLARNIINEFDTDHDGKLSVEELIEAIKNTDDINEHALSEETEHQDWFNQPPNENQTITLEVPIVNSPAKIDDRLTKGIPLLGRMFKRVGANSVSKQLDIHNGNLAMQITDELVNHNTNLSSDELQLFIELYLEKKRETESSIDWMEFRDLFSPMVNNGYYSKINIKKWFEVIDTNEHGIITTEQVLQLLRLFQIENLEEILSKLNEITDDTDSCTFDELIFILDNLDSSTSHLLINPDSMASFDTDWLSKTIF